MHAASENTVAKQRFTRSIAPHLVRSPGFHRLLRDGSIPLADGARKYKVDTGRFENFFDHLTCAIYFDRYGVPLNRSAHRVQHVYLSLLDDDPEEQQRRKLLVMWQGHFYEDFQSMISSYESGRINDESIYANKIIDPAGTQGSITIAHTFYGVFDVVSLLTGSTYQQDA
jgi:hypothetical protein